MDSYTRANLANWESRVPGHARSTDYGLDRFVTDPRHLSGVVSRDTRALGDLSGLRVAHLQCHIGTDTLSLARLGAEVTGIDFSPSALEVARDLAARAGPAVRYVEASVDTVPDRVRETFDLVYTGIGALNWLPSVDEWARVVAGLLAPGGRLFVRDGHPVLSAVDDERDDDLLVLAHPYFETQEPLRWESTATYTDDADDLGELDAPVSYEWSHGLGETVQAVLDAGLRLTRLAEHRDLAWRALPGMVAQGDGTWALAAGRDRLPLSFSLEALREG